MSERGERADGHGGLRECATPRRRRGIRMSERADGPGGPGFTRPTEEAA
jgi:hypothetical protein